MENYKATEQAVFDSRHKKIYRNLMVIFIKIKHIFKIDLSCV